MPCVKESPRCRGEELFRAAIRVVDSMQKRASEDGVLTFVPAEACFFLDELMKYPIPAGAAPVKYAFLRGEQGSPMVDFLLTVENFCHRLPTATARGIEAGLMIKKNDGEKGSNLIITITHGSATLSITLTKKDVTFAADSLQTTVPTQIVDHTPILRGLEALTVFGSLDLEP